MNTWHFVGDLPKRYIRTLSNIITCLTDLRRYDEAKEMIVLMRSLKEQEGFDYPYLETTIFKNTGLAELDLSHSPDNSPKD
jgi:pentatricopeptide repeat protein